MATEVVMPKLGNEIEACTLLSWRKREGEKVGKGEPLAEIETDKATFEVEAPASGVLLKVFFQPGAEVPVRTVIAAIGEPGESVAHMRPPESETGAVVKAAGSSSPAVPRTGPASAHGVSPRARRAAEEAGLDASGVPGSGPGGRVLERDVRADLSGREPPTPAARDRLSELRSGSGIGGRILASDIHAAAGPAVHAAAPAPDYSGLGPSKETPVAGMRRVIATRLLHSARTTAPVTLHAGADASALRAARAQLKGEAQTYRITINDLLIWIVARTLPRYTALNAWWLGDRIVEFEQVHLAVAVQTPRGLMAPVIRRAESLSLAEISAEAKRLRQACLDGTAKPGELTGATFTVTNLGPQGVEFFTPILNPPEVAILGVGAIVLRPTEGPGGLRMIPHLGLSLTFDHQAIDGHGAAVFLEALAEAIKRVRPEALDA